MSNYFAEYLIEPRLSGLTVKCVSWAHSMTVLPVTKTMCCKTVSALQMSPEELMAQQNLSRFENLVVVLRGRLFYLVHAGTPELHVQKWFKFEGSRARTLFQFTGQTIHNGVC